MSGCPCSSVHVSELRADLRDGWFIRPNTSKVPRGWYALEYGMETTTATRHLVAAIHPNDLDKVRGLYPEAFIVRKVGDVPVEDINAALAWRAERP